MQQKAQDKHKFDKKMLVLGNGTQLETEEEILAQIILKKQFRSRNSGGIESPLQVSKSGKDRSETQTNTSLYLPHIKQFIPRSTIFNKQSPGRQSPSPENPLDPDFGTNINGGVGPFPSLPMHRGSPLGHHRNEDTNQGS